MTEQIFDHGPAWGDTRRVVTSIGLLAAIWVGGVTAIAAVGGFDVPADSPALPTLVAIIAPVLGFGLSMISPRLRALVLGFDPVLLVELQAWRILGGLFVAVYAFGHLPGLFAWPAGLGDVAVGVAAPFVAWQLRRNRAFLISARLRWFTYLGLTDFAIAVGTGLAARNQIPGLVEGVTSSAMGQMPLVLIPTLAVPAFIILHIIVLMQIRVARHRGARR